jgi:hypothetical protein
MVPPGEGSSVVRSLSDIPADFKAQIAEREAEGFKERFITATEGKTDGLVMATYENLTDSPDIIESGITSFNVSEYRDAGGAVLGVRVFLYFDKNDYKDYVSFEIGKDGTVSGFNQTITDALSKKLGGRRPIDFAKVVLGELERVGIGFWSESDTPILPDSDETETGIGEGRPPGDEPYLDVRRLVMLKQLEKRGAVFGLGSPDDDGSDSYRALIFPYGILLENPVTWNAAYTIDIRRNQNISEEEWTEAISVLQKMRTKEGIEAFKSRFITPLFQRSTTRRELRDNEGGKQRVHQGSWEDRLIDAAIALTTPTQ